MQLTERQQSLITDLANDLAPVVGRIEAGIKTTQNHYGAYGALIGKLSGGSRQSANIIGLAMIEAGANRQGVVDAIKCFT